MTPASDLCEAGLCVTFDNGVNIDRPKGRDGDQLKETTMAIINFKTEVMADGPSGYWRLGEAPGSGTAADETTNQNNGKCTGGITFGQPGFHGGDTAALFDGAT